MSAVVSPIARSFPARPYSPVPPPCPSPQLAIRPLPPAPVYSRHHQHHEQPLSPRSPRPRHVSAHPVASSSRIPLPVGPPPSSTAYARRASEPALPFPASRQRKQSTSPARAVPSVALQPFSPVPDFISPTSPRKHPRSDSGLSPPSPGHQTRSLARARTRSPIPPPPLDFAPPPPVPPLPSMRGVQREGRKLRPIRIPELGLGLGRARSIRRDKDLERERMPPAVVSTQSSFLDMPAPRDAKSDDGVKLGSCFWMGIGSGLRSAQSAPNMKGSSKRRSASVPAHGPPFPGRRLLRVGFGAPHAVA